MQTKHKIKTQEVEKTKYSNMASKKVRKTNINNSENLTQNKKKIQKIRQEKTINFP